MLAWIMRIVVSTPQWYAMSTPLGATWAEHMSLESAVGTHTLTVGSPTTIATGARCLESALVTTGKRTVLVVVDISLRVLVVSLDVNVVTEVVEMATAY